MSHQHENPSLEPSEPKEAAPLNITFDMLNADPSSVNREGLTPAENAALDFVALVENALEPARVGEQAPADIEYDYTGTPDFLTPDVIRINAERSYNGETSDFLSYRVVMGEWADSPALAVSFVTERLPSMTDNPEDGEEVLDSFSLDFAYDGTYSTAHVSSEHPAETDQEHIEYFQNTIARIQGMLAVDYEPVLPQK